jgi:glycosyltransferase involved in cell wall biosynthesis
MRCAAGDGCGQDGSDVSGPGAVSVAIPTYRREAVLVETVESLLMQDPAPAEILVLDQSDRHEAATEARLSKLADAGAIRWIRLAEPSIPAAMNQGLVQAAHDVVLFLDDDIRPDPGLIAWHQRGHDEGHELVAGRVIQPWHEGLEFPADEPFHFACTKAQAVREFMGGNFSVRRSLAIGLGGFDENFLRVAYHFEAEFAWRWVRSGRNIRFEPRACLHHLKVSAGGTRSFGEPLTTWRSDHAVGAYYCWLRTGQLGGFVTRPIRSVATRFHLRNPWRIPVTLMAEFGGMAWALILFARGPRHLVSTPRP